MSTKAHLALLVMTLLSVGFILHLVRRRRLRAKYSILWLSVGVVLILLAAWPELLDRVSDWLGVDYGPATFLLGATTLLFLIVIHFSWELSRLEERTRSLAEELALRSVAAPSNGRHPGEDGVVLDAPAPAESPPMGEPSRQATSEPAQGAAPSGDHGRGGPPPS